MFTVCIAILSITALLRFSVYFILTKKVLAHKEKLSTDQNEGVSVIICAKNEIHNLKQNLDIILNQQYPTFEVIVIDDYSTDDTWHYLQSITCSKLVPIQALEDKLGKKYALQTGINKAKYDLLLLTDADCRPSSPNWIAHMASNVLHNQKDIVLGFSPMQKVANFLGLLSRYETLHTALMYLGSSLLGYTYMGVGRNMLYRKSYFLAKGGFSDQLQTAAGDDDLLIQKLANRENVAICMHQEAWIYTSPRTTIKSYFQQKSRHIGVAHLYLHSFKISLMIWAIIQLLFYISLCLGLYLAWKLTILFYFIFIIAVLVVLHPIAKKWKDSMLSIGFPIFDLCFTMLNPLFLIYSKLKNKTW